MPPIPHPERPASAARGGRWLPWVVTRLLATLLLVYIASYVLLYERGVAEANAIGYPYFFYVPFETVASDGELNRHYQLLTLYEPLSLAHRRWFRGREPCRGLTLGLRR